MRLSVVLLVLSLAGVLGGAAIIGLHWLGGAVIFDSLCIGLYALMRDDGESKPQVHKIPGAGQSLVSILDRARNAS